MKIITIVAGILLLATLQVQAQVGIQTEAPQSLLHVDAASNNGNVAPVTDEQKQDDFVVSDSAFTGVGDPYPDQKLVVNGKLRINDGTQSKGSLLVSDANGKAQWRGNVSIKGKYSKYLLAGTGIGLSDLEVVEPDASAPTPVVMLTGTSAIVDNVNSIGLIPIENGVHVPYGKYYLVLNGDVSASREFCSIFLMKNNVFWTRISYIEYLAGVTLMLVVEDKAGIDLSLAFADRDLGDSENYFAKMQGSGAAWWYELDFHLMGSTIFY
ncbi:MAG: hypothetical protein LBS01_06815 [Prevotellaceae bacterium]|jgi:hypothetical protein|nr:hypothetical protein [Prevotellaceae bacterium]